jgi:hypothetical protein
MIVQITPRLTLLIEGRTIIKIYFVAVLKKANPMTLHCFQSNFGDNYARTNF